MTPQEPKYKYGSTQVNLPAPLAKRIKAWARQWIGKDILTGDGYETQPHITVKYGIKADKPLPALKAALAPLGPITAHLRTVQVFDTNPDFDVLYLSVDSPDLAAANKVVKNAVACDDTHPTYTPHITLAYVEKGKGYDMVGIIPLPGEAVTFDTVMLSSRGGRQPSIELMGENMGEEGNLETKKGLGMVAFVLGKAVNLVEPAHPHLMTKTAYFNATKNIEGTDSMGRPAVVTRAQSDTFHRACVKNALALSRPVPAAVQKQYPDLMQEHHVKPKEWHETNNLTEAQHARLNSHIKAGKVSVERTGKYGDADSFKVRDLRGARAKPVGTFSDWKAARFAAHTAMKTSAAKPVTKSVAAPSSSASHPFLGVVLPGGTVSDYHIPTAAPGPPSHSLHYADAGLTGFDNDKTLRYVKNLTHGHYELEGHPALHPDEKGAHQQIKALAQHLSERGVPHSTPLVCADHGYSRSAYPHQGKSLGTVGDYAGLMRIKSAYEPYYGDNPFTNIDDHAPLDAIFDTPIYTDEMVRHYCDIQGVPWKGSCVDPDVIASKSQATLDAPAKTEVATKGARIAFLIKSLPSGLKAGDAHPTMPHLPPSDTATRSIVKERGHAPVPPASWGLHVSPDPEAKVQATWRDAAGRSQSRYHKDHDALASQHKYAAMNGFTHALPRIRAKVTEDLHLPDAHPDRVKAAVVHLMDHAALRVGSEKYAEDNGTFGASSLRKSHVSVSHDAGETHAVKLNFTAKHGLGQEKEVHDPLLHAAVSHLLEQPGDRLFQQRTKTGGLAPVTEKHVNDYLRKIAPGTHAHQFRTYHATRIAAAHLLGQPHTDDPKQKQKHVTAAYEKASQFLGNSPAMAKASYVNPETIKNYMNGTLGPQHLRE